jgi:HEPN domain-containing protein
MEQQLKYDEWFFQSDYDLETAYHMLQTGRNVYCIFMCHLSLEKALKGLFIKRLNQIPPKIHNLLYFVEKLMLEPEETYLDFLVSTNRMSIATRYAEDMRSYDKTLLARTYQQTKTIQQWIKNL